MEIIEFNEVYSEGVKDLLVELQEYVVKIDKYKQNILSPLYREEYYAMLTKTLNENSGKMFLALENEKVVGLICGHLEIKEDEDHLVIKDTKRAVINELIVSQNIRSGGIGSKLMCKMEDYLKNLGAKFILLDVFAYNETAKTFYKNKGYEERMITLIKEINNDWVNKTYSFFTIFRWHT